jgi:hypothetical protein
MRQEDYMRFFSDCSGCETCQSYFTICVAGHGDNEYYPVTEEWINDLFNRKLVKEAQKEELFALFPALRDKWEQYTKPEESYPAFRVKTLENSPRWKRYMGEQV